MTLPTDNLDFAVLLHRQMQQRAITAGQIEGVAPPGLDFAAVVERLENLNWLISSNVAARRLEFQLPLGFFESFPALIKARPTEALRRFYLADVDCLVDGSAPNAPAEVRHYLQAVEFWSLLARASDHEVGSGRTKTLVFLHQKKVEIGSDYDRTDLRELNGLDGFRKDFIETETHLDQKRTIVKTVLMEVFANRTKVPLSALLACFDDFVERVRAGYQLYVSEFSFQKVKEQVEKEKLDAMVKLNKVFSDIQSQLLAVPVALVLVGGQMEKSGTPTAKNLLIWLGAFVFAVLMDLLIRNQRHTLKAVKHEIDQQKQVIKDRYSDLANRFASIYQEIDERHTHQIRLIWTVDFLVAVSLIVTTYLFASYSGLFALPI